MVIFMPDVMAACTAGTKTDGSNTVVATGIRSIVRNWKAGETSWEQLEMRGLLEIEAGPL
jgi:hypothetical protein